MSPIYMPLSEFESLRNQANLNPFELVLDDEVALSDIDSLKKMLNVSLPGGSNLTSDQLQTIQQGVFECNSSYSLTSINPSTSLEMGNLTHERLLNDMIEDQEELPKEPKKRGRKKLPDNVVDANIIRSQMVCKRRATLFKKVAKYMKDLQLPALILAQDNKGQWEMLGTPELEQRVLNNQNVIDAKKEVVM